MELFCTDHKWIAYAENNLLVKMRLLYNNEHVKNWKSLGTPLCSFLSSNKMKVLPYYSWHSCQLCYCYWHSFYLFIHGVLFISKVLWLQICLAEIRTVLVKYLSLEKIKQVKSNTQILILLSQKSHCYSSNVNITNYLNSEANKICLMCLEELFHPRVKAIVSWEHKG